MQILCTLIPEYDQSNSPLVCCWLGTHIPLTSTFYYAASANPLVLASYEKCTALLYSISYTWLHFQSSVFTQTLRGISSLASRECLGRFLDFLVRVTAWCVASTQDDQEGNNYGKGDGTKHDGPPILLYCFS